MPPESDEPLPGSLDLVLDLDVEVDPEDDDDDEEALFVYGDIVRDRETDSSNDLVGVNVPGISAKELELMDRETLAGRNPGYPADDEVIFCTPKEVIDERIDYWQQRSRPIQISKLIEDEIPFQPFPHHRLVLVEKSHLREK